MVGAMSAEKGDAARAVTRNLHAAIERVREDVAKVEFWADAVTGFTQPVPEYKASEAKIWMPAEQAKNLGGKRPDGPESVQSKAKPATKKRRDG